MSRRPARSATVRPCGGGAGETHVVGGIDERPARLRARTCDDLPGGVRHAGPPQQFEPGQRGQRGLGIWLGDDGVAGGQGCQPVAEPHGERVVPRRDDRHDPLRVVVNVDPREDREDARTALRAQQPRRVFAVIAGGQRDVEDLLHRIGSALARLDNDQVGEFHLMGQHKVVKLQKSSAPCARAERGPRRLQGAGCCERVLDIGGARLGDLREGTGVQRGEGRLRRARRGAHERGQAIDGRGGQQAGGGDVRGHASQRRCALSAPSSHGG